MALKTLICIPCMDQVPAAFMRSIMHMRTVGDVRIGMSVSSLVYDSRNQLANQAIDGGFDRTLWFDSDMTFDADTMERLSARMDEGRDMVSGIYFTRKKPIVPVIYSECGFAQGEDGKMIPAAKSYRDYPKNEIFQVEGIGFGCCMVTVELLKKVKDTYGLPFSPAMGFGEDLSFCGRAIELGAKIWVDSSIKCGHIAQSLVDEDTFLTGGGL